MSVPGIRSGRLAFVSVILLAWLVTATCTAMVYRPSVGRFKDTLVLWHQGQFYLFSMYTPDVEANFRNVWLATSSDGVHWEHVGPVIEDAPFNIWAMSVHRVGDRFIMNHGSFSDPGVQNVIRFWESTDLVHWTFMGHEADLFPDARWYHPKSRLDCMSVVPVAEDSGRTKYFGFATGPGGFLESEDGIRWSGMPQPQVDWCSVPPPPTPPDEGGFEVGGCHAIDGKYYLVGGWFNYMGGTGYGVYTLIAGSPRGPFRADAAAYRLCGNSTPDPKEHVRALSGRHSCPDLQYDTRTGQHWPDARADRVHRTERPGRVQRSESLVNEPGRARLIHSARRFDDQSTRVCVSRVLRPCPSQF